MCRKWWEKNNKIHLPLWIAGTSSPSASSRMIVPETGDVLSSSKANFLEAFRLGGDILVFFVGLPRWLLGESSGGEGRLLIPKGFKGGDPSPMDFNVRSVTPTPPPGTTGWHFGSNDAGKFEFGGEFKLGLLLEDDATATAALAKSCCCKNSGDNGLDVVGLKVELFPPFRDDVNWFW